MILILVELGNKHGAVELAVRCREGVI